jgi:hypothetical protein
MKYEEFESLVKEGLYKEKTLLLFELYQREEEGYNVAEARKAFKNITRKNKSNLEAIFKNVSRLSSRTDFPYAEPSDLEGIRAERPKGARKIAPKFSEEQIFDKIYGGWLGRCAGCLLGKPVEGLHKNQIEEWLKLAGVYPLNNYFPPLHGIKNVPEWLKNFTPEKDTLLGNITYMVRDDDIDFTILNLHLLETKGLKFSTADVGNNWLEEIPYNQIYATDHLVYKNLVNGLIPPKTAFYKNPYREWGGAPNSSRHVRLCDTGDA